MMIWDISVFCSFPSCNGEDEHSFSIYLINHLTCMPNWPCCQCTITPDHCCHWTVVWLHLDLFRVKMSQISYNFILRCICAALINSCDRYKLQVEWQQQFGLLKPAHKMIRLQHSLTFLLIFFFSWSEISERRSEPWDPVSESTFRRVLTWVWRVRQHPGCLTGGDTGCWVMWQSAPPIYCSLSQTQAC